MTQNNQASAPGYVTNVPPASMSSGAPVRAGWVCLALAWCMFLVPISFSSIVGWALTLAALIISIIVMSKGKVGQGVVQLVCAIVVSPTLYFIGLLIATAIVAKAVSQKDTPPPPPPASVQTPVINTRVATATTPPPPVVVELNKDTVIDALKRSSVDSLPVFLKISDATFEVVNSVDTSRVIKGEVTLEFLEDTFVKSSRLTFRTQSSSFDVQLLKTMKKKGNKVALPFETRFNLTNKPLSIGMPRLDNYGEEIAKYRHCYPEGGEVAVKAQAMIDAAENASRKAQLVANKWDALKRLSDSLVDADTFKDRYEHGRIDINTAFDDTEYSDNWIKTVSKTNFNSWADRYAAHKKMIQPRFDQAYPPVEKIINDARDKAVACSEYLLGL